MGSGVVAKRQARSHCGTHARRDGNATPDRRHRYRQDAGPPLRAPAARDRPGVDLGRAGRRFPRTDGTPQGPALFHGRVDDIGHPRREPGDPVRLHPR